MKKLTKKAIDGIMKKNEGVLTGDFIAIQKEKIWQNMVESGRIFDKSMHDLFYGKDEEGIQDLINKIGQMELLHYPDRDQQFQNKRLEWYRLYGEYVMLKDFKKKPPVQLPKQILALHYLLKMFGKGFEDIHGDKTKQAKLLSIIFGKNEDNIRHRLSLFLQPLSLGDYYRENHTDSLVDILNDIGREDLAEEIKKTTENIKSKNLG